MKRKKTILVILIIIGVIILGTLHGVLGQKQFSVLDILAILCIFGGALGFLFDPNASDWLLNPIFRHAFV